MLSFSAVLISLTLCQVQEFHALGYSVPSTGVWYPAGTAASAMPLGALGTGFVDLTSAGTFGDSTAENNWLKPQQVAPGCGFSLLIGGRRADLYPNKPPTPGLRFWGHYPAADMEFGNTFGDVEVYARAYAPLVPHDYDVSCLPVTFFRFLVNNRGGGPVAAELAFQWEATVPSSERGQGNVEGALRWRRAELAPGAVWKPTPILAFGPNRDEAVARAKAALKVDPRGLVPSTVPEGNAYTFGGVRDFFVDVAGGFNWESCRRESATYAGAPQIGQLFWNLSYGGQCAGRGPDGTYGLKGQTLPARTSDGALEVRLRVCEAGPDTVALVYTVLNVSSKPVKDLEFGFAANIDLGGPSYAETQRAGFDKDLPGIAFSDDRVNMAAVLAGETDGFITGTFPQVHTAMAKSDWTPQEISVPGPVVTDIPNGLQLKSTNGSYAIAASADGWQLTPERPSPNVLRTKAVRTVAAGETVEVTFALAWHFPTWTSSDNEPLQHRYAVMCQDAGGVIGVALPKAAEIEKRVIAWQQPIYISPTPGLLRDAVINGLYVLPRNSWWLSDGRFFQSETFTGCPITETFVCRFYGSFPLAVLFPECERATMRSVAAAQKPDGEIPFGFGSPTASRSPYYHVQHPIVSPEFALVTWRNYGLWNDVEYLKEMYPHVQAALRFAMTLDKDGDGLVNEDPGNEKGFPANQYYDIWPWWGTSAYTAGIWLAALRAGEEMAKRMDDAAFASELHGWYERGLKAYGDKLWTGSYYRLYNDPERQRMSTTSLTNALCGQWFAYASGLGEILPKECILEQTEAVLRWNVAATPYGAVNGVKPDGSPDETFPDHSAVITIGEVWSFCTMAVYAGRAREAVQLFNTSYGNILLLQRTPWNIPWSLDRQTGAIKWGVNYYSNPCVWTFLEALDPKTYLQLAKNDMTLHFPPPPQ